MLKFILTDCKIMNNKVIPIKNWTGLRYFKERNGKTRKIKCVKIPDHGLF